MTDTSVRQEMIDTAIREMNKLSARDIKLVIALYYKDHFQAKIPNVLSSFQVDTDKLQQQKSMMILQSLQD